MIIDASNNSYASNPNFKLVDFQNTYLDQRPVEKLTYKDATCLLIKVLHVAHLIFVTLATLGLILCCLKGRRLWKTSLDAFKDYIVFQNPRIPLLVPFPNHTLQNNIPTLPAPQALTTPVIGPSPSQPLQNNAPTLPAPQATPATVIAAAPAATIALPLSNNQLLQIKKQILTCYPAWRSTVNTWTGISLTDQIWLLQIFELRALGVSFPIIDTILNSTNIANIANENQASDLLDQRYSVKHYLETITYFSIHHKNLTTAPTGISLLTNLESLHLHNNQLTTPPDITKNTKLTVLDLNSNQLTTVPDTSKNTKLTYLHLQHNQLTIPPDTSKNTELTSLFLSFNQLTIPPDISKNTKLNDLFLLRNQLTSLPDTSQNTELTHLSLAENQLTISPDTSKNTKLTNLSLELNQLTTPPDISHNTALTRLVLSYNQLTTSPNISKNTMLNNIYFNNNQLTTFPDISKITKLDNLNLDNNKLVDITNMSFLRRISISLKNNPLSAASKAHLKALNSPIITY